MSDIINTQQLKIKSVLKDLLPFFPKDIIELIFNYFFVEYVQWDFDEMFYIPFYLAN